MLDDFLSDYDLEYPSHVTIHHMVEYWYITFLGRKKTPQQNLKDNAE